MSRMSSCLLASAVFLVASALAAARTPTVASQWDGVFSDQQAERGRIPYARLCSRCHGADLQGVLSPIRYPGAPLTYPSLVGDEFRAMWNELSLGDLFERIRISMPPDAPGTVPPAMVADILAFVLQSGGWPSGASELPANATRLATIQFRAIRP